MASDNSDLIKDLVELLGGGFVGSVARDIISWFRGIKKDDAEAKAVLVTAETSQFSAVTDSWEKRTEDLLREVHSLRDEVRSLRILYDTQQMNHHEQMLAMQRAHLEQMASLREELEEARMTRGIGV